MITKIDELVKAEFSKAFFETYGFYPNIGKDLTLYGESTRAIYKMWLASRNDTLDMVRNFCAHHIESLSRSDCKMEAVGIVFLGQDIEKNMRVKDPFQQKETNND